MKNTYYHAIGTTRTLITKNTETKLATYTAPSAGAYFLSGVIQYDNSGDDKMDVRNYVCNELNKPNYYGGTYIGGRGTTTGRFLMPDSTITTAKAGEPLSLIAYVTGDNMYYLSYTFNVIKLI